MLMALQRVSERKQVVQSDQQSLLLTQVSKNWPITIDGPPNPLWRLVSSAVPPGKISHGRRGEMRVAGFFAGVMVDSQ
jgi:hypothetical protein